MSLITRCPACRTMFKVVADQLRVSGGWVRCGHCADVFDASANLQSLPLAPISPFSPPPSLVLPASVAWPEVPLSLDDHPIPVPLPVPSAAALQRPAESDKGDPRQHAETVVRSPVATFGDRLSNAGAATDSDADDLYQSDIDPAVWNQKTGSVLTHEAELPSQVDGIPPASVDSGIKLQGIAETPYASDDVSFVRDALRKEFWRKPVIRIALCFLSLMLLVGLLLQVAIHQKDTIAALEPRLKPLLQTLCAEIGCKLAPLKRIDMLVIESSSFNKINADSYRLSFMIKNGGPVAVAMPSLEVTLTDTQENPVLRRVILPAQFGAASAILPAGSDITGLVSFQLSESESVDAASPGVPMRVAGYRVLAFYP